MSSLSVARCQKVLVSVVLMLMSSAIFASQQVRIYEPLTPKSVQKLPAKEYSGQPAASVTLPVEPVSSMKVNPKPVKLSLDQQIQLIDAEILVLKAELARKNGNKEQVRHYLQELDQKYSIPLPEKMRAHIQSLRQYLQAEKTAQDDSESNTPESGFIFDDRKVVVLLPLSGPYEKIGKAIRHGLEVEFSTVKLTFFDTHIYESMLQLWELVRLYQPTFMIGPLQKENVEAFSRLNTGVPTLYLNELPEKKPYERSLSLNRENHVNALI
ncbi:MAG: penicillin-binding protein activator, partial [Hydrogenovibrio sp.]|nr:penicillin-binding protein activator [Hydrogenovibrio sp.]